MQKIKKVLFFVFLGLFIYPLLPQIIRHDYMDQAYLKLSRYFFVRDSNLFTNLGKTKYIPISYKLVISNQGREETIFTSGKNDFFVGISRANYIAAPLLALGRSSNLEDFMGSNRLNLTEYIYSSEEISTRVRKLRFRPNFSRTKLGRDIIKKRCYQKNEIPIVAVVEFKALVDNSTFKKRLPYMIYDCSLAGNYNGS